MNLFHEWYFFSKKPFAAKTADGISRGIEEIELNMTLQRLIRGKIHTQVATCNINITFESETPTLPFFNIMETNIPSFRRKTKKSRIFKSSYNGYQETSKEHQSFSLNIDGCWWRCLCALTIQRAMLARAYAPGSATHARQVKGEKPDKYSERRSHWQQSDGWRYSQVIWFHNWLYLHVFIRRQTAQFSWALRLECP